MKKYFGSVLVLAMVLMASTGFACTPGQPGCVSATDYSNTTAYQYTPSSYGWAESSASTVRGAEANTGKYGFGKATTVVGGTSFDNATAFSGGFGNGTNKAGSYGLSTSVAAGAEGALATRLIGNTTTHAYVGVSGDARQTNNSLAVAGDGTTFAMGGNYSQANYSGRNDSYGKSLIIGSGAAAVNAGEATAMGGTLMSASTVPFKSASSAGITGSTSQAGPNGQVTGNGGMETQAQMFNGRSGGWTQTSGTYCYTGSDKGAGFTAGGGTVNISNTPHTSTVTSLSGQVSYSTGGSLAPIPAK